MNCRRKKGIENKIAVGRRRRTDIYWQAKGRYGRGCRPYTRNKEESFYQPMKFFSTTLWTIHPDNVYHFDISVHPLFTIWAIVKRVAKNTNGWACWWWCGEYGVMPQSRRLDMKRQERKKRNWEPKWFQLISNAWYVASGKFAEESSIWLLRCLITKLLPQ